MIKICIPTFDETTLQHKGFVYIKIKNKPDWRDVNKIVKHLPDTPAGGIGPNPLQDLLTDKRREVRAFYDGRQRTKKLKGFYVVVCGDPSVPLSGLQLVDKYGC